MDSSSLLTVYILAADADHAQAVSHALCTRAREEAATLAVQTTPPPPEAIRRLSLCLLLGLAPAPAGALPPDLGAPCHRDDDPTHAAEGDSVNLEAIDAQLRSTLHSSDHAFHVLHGSTAQQLTSAWQAVQSHPSQRRRTSPSEIAIKNIALNEDNTPTTGLFNLKSANLPAGEGSARTSPERAARLRAWYCEKCSDPECEHRLFTALTESR